MELDQNQEQVTEKSVEELVAEQVAAKEAEMLATMKEKLDKAYGAKEEAEKALRERQQAEQAALKESMEKESKWQELREMEKAESERKFAEMANAYGAMQQELHNYKMDVSVSNALAGQDFVNPEAKKMFTNLIKNSVTSADEVEHTVTSLSQNDDYKFLFKKPETAGNPVTAGNMLGSTITQPKSNMTAGEQAIAELQAKFGNQ